MTTADRIRVLRIQKGYSQQELADLLHVKKQTIGKYEQGIITNIPLSKVTEMAHIFGVTEAELVGWNVNKSAKQEILDILDGMPEEQLQAFLTIIKQFKK